MPALVTVVLCVILEYVHSCVQQSRAEQHYDQQITRLTHAVGMDCSLRTTMHTQMLLLTAQATSASGRCRGALSHADTGILASWQWLQAYSMSVGIRWANSARRAQSMQACEGSRMPVDADTLAIQPILHCRLTDVVKKNVVMTISLQLVNANELGRMSL